MKPSIIINNLSFSGLIAHNIVVEPETISERTQTTYEYKSLSCQRWRSYDTYPASPPPKSQSCASSQLNWQTYCIYLSYLKGTGQEDIMLKHQITHHKAIKLKKPLKLYFCLVLLAQNSKCPCTLPRWLTSGKTCLEGHWLFLRIVN